MDDDATLRRLRGENCESEARRILREQPDSFIKNNYRRILATADSAKWSKGFIRELLSRLSSYSLRWGHGDDPPFHLACDSGQLLIAEVLLDILPPEVMWQRTRRRLPLFASIWYGGLSVAPLLIERMPADKLVEGDYLSTAAHEGYLDIVRRLAAKVPPSEFGKAFLKISCGDKAAVGLLLARRMTIADLTEKAPAMLSSMFTHFRYQEALPVVVLIIQRLQNEGDHELDFHSLLSACNPRERYTVLVILCQHHCHLPYVAQVTCQLTDEDYSRPLYTGNGTTTPLHEAVAVGSLAVVRHLVATMPRAARSLPNRDSKSPLDLAVEKGDTPIISCLQPMAKKA